MPFIAGEPIREQKLVKANGAGFMAAILPSGMRAVSTEISAETGAGGFILPNDRVDVVLSKRERRQSDEGGGPPEIISSQVVLSNVRVLAIDQAPKEKEGQNAVLGKTATLELKPEEVQTLAKARMSGTLSLALRSIADGRNTTVATADSTRITVYRGAGSPGRTELHPSLRTLILGTGGPSDPSPWPRLEFARSVRHAAGMLLAWIGRASDKASVHERRLTRA